MKYVAAAMLVPALAAILAGCSQNSGTSPATAPAAQAVKYERYSGYFESNRFAPDVAESTLIITNQASFDKDFSVAAADELVMKDQSHRIPNDLFATQIVVALIQRGHTPWTYRVMDVTSQDDILTVQYEAMGSGALTRATITSPLIISVPKAVYRQVRFVPLPAEPQS